MSSNSLQLLKNILTWKPLLVLLAVLCVWTPQARAAFPLSDTLSPSSTAPVSWAGTATGPANTSPVTSCREGIDCDTFILTFNGTTADWAGRTSIIQIGWQLPATDYDLYILRELPGGPFVVAQAVNHPANSHDTREMINFSPAFYGAGRYLVRVMYTAANFHDQYSGSATVVADESTCRVPGLTVLRDSTGDSSDAQTNHDIESVSVAEPYLIGTSKLVFTLKLSGLATLTPGTFWRVYFRAPNVAGPRYFVDMRTDATGAVSYKYGTGDGTTVGDADEGHYNAQTGAITITVSNGKVGGPGPNRSPAQKLEQIYAQVILGAAAVDSAPDSNFDLSQASYEVVGNGGCNPGKIAFISDNDGNNEVYLMDASGGNPINLTNHPATEYSPSWSPDGTKITFASSRAGSHDIFVMDADGNNLSNLTNQPGSDLEPGWSPDGRKIAFDGWRDTDLTTGTAQIYVMDASGSNQTRLTHDTAYYRQPNFSPDGRQLVFWGGAGLAEIFVMNADGTNMRQLTNGYENLYAEWSPDGTRIAFTSSRDGNYEIYVMNPDGTNLKRLTNTSAQEFNPAWSPDGLALLFVSSRDGNYELYAMNADGSNQTRLTNSASAEGFPAWQPRIPPTVSSPPVVVLTKNTDFDGDNKDDLAFWRSSNATWNILNSSNNGTRIQSWGGSKDVPVPGDYDGDGKADLGSVVSDNGIWTISLSGSSSIRIMPAGQRGDVPAPGDYDGDGKCDIAFYRPNEVRWYILQTSNGATRSLQFGATYDRLVPGDYDGDGKTDVAVFRPNEGKWYITNNSGGFTVQTWGLPGDVPVPADYDGDGKTDLAVYRPSQDTWHILNSSTNSLRSVQWGINGDLLTPADYDGDGKADVAIWRPLEGDYYVIRSSDGAGVRLHWGQSGDLPLQFMGFA